MGTLIMINYVFIKHIYYHGCLTKFLSNLREDYHFLSNLIDTVKFENRINKKYENRNSIDAINDEMDAINDEMILLARKVTEDLDLEDLIEMFDNNDYNGIFGVVYEIVPNIVKERIKERETKKKKENGERDKKKKKKGGGKKKKKKKKKKS